MKTHTIYIAIISILLYQLNYESIATILFIGSLTLLLNEIDGRKDATVSKL